MATITFKYRGKSDTGNLTIRLQHSTSIDYRVSSKIVSSKIYWFTSQGKHRKVKDLTYLGADAKNHKNYLDEVDEKLIDRFKKDFNNGVPISKEWFVKNIIDVTRILSDVKDIKGAQDEINKTLQEVKDKETDVYNKNLITYAIQNVIDNEYNDNATQRKIYNQSMAKVESYQKAIKKSFTILDVTQNFIDRFYNFLKNDLKHQHSTSIKHCKSLLHSVRYQKNAYPTQVQISSGVRDIKYKKQSKSQKAQTRSEIVVTLSFKELDAINNTTVPERLLNAKKVILFGCEVGLRVSDFGKLTKENIVKTNDLEYWNFRNQKTMEFVVIPITSRIKKYVELYGMPRTEYNGADDVLINREIKEVCSLAGINEKVKGRKSQVMVVNGQKTRRTVAMKYTKSEIITNHSLRRSFATNYYKILEPNQIRQITGHTTDAQLMEYINQDKDKDDIVLQMANKMNQTEALNNKKISQLKIIKKASNH